MFDRLMTVLELALLGVIVWQGELIRRYEKWTYEMTRERWEEKAKWREQKRQQQSKRGSETKISDSAKPMESLSPTTTESLPPKTDDAPSVDENQKRSL